MRILILSNLSNEEVSEDILIARSFKYDGHDVCITNMDYDEKLEDIYDVFIKRNTWDEDETKLNKYLVESEIVDKRLNEKNKCRINFSGKFDSIGKIYMVELYEKKYQVIPTINSLDDINKLNCDKYILKPKESYDGFGQMKLAKKELREHFSSDYVIQPLIDFQSEIQFYFVGRTFEYALEFKPSKVPIYPTPIIYDYTIEEKNIAQSFANLNNNLIGVQRIDFLKLNDGKLLLLEIEDVAPHLELESVYGELQNKFLVDYKMMVYNAFKEFSNEDRL